MPRRHFIIYVPGLGDNRVRGQTLALALWRVFGVQTQLYQMNWVDGEAFPPKLERLLAQIDAYHAAGRVVSLVAASAGASAALNAYVQRPDKISGVVFICGKLGGSFHPSYHQTNPAFAQSMEMLPKNLGKLLPADTAKMLSLHPIDDPIVPIANTKLPGVLSQRMPVHGHFLGIAYGLTVRAGANVRFLKRTLSQAF
jgi:pimeloyl-ACP methyl ester carboxylesterase